MILPCPLPVLLQGPRGLVQTLAMPGGARGKDIREPLCLSIYAGERGNHHLGSQGTTVDMEPFEDSRCPAVRYEDQVLRRRGLGVRMSRTCGSTSTTCNSPLPISCALALAALCFLSTPGMTRSEAWGIKWLTAKRCGGWHRPRRGPQQQLMSSPPPWKPRRSPVHRLSPQYSTSRRPLAALTRRHPVDNPL